MSLSFKLKSVVSSALIASAFVAASGVQAAAVVGSQGLAINGTVTPVSPGLANASGPGVLTLTLLTVTGSQFGDFVSGTTIGTNLGTVTFDLANISSFMFSNAVFGNFQASSVFELPTTNPNSREYYIQGTFSAGSFSAKNDPTSATLDLTLNQAQGPGSAISSSATFFTPALQVPLPGTLALLGLGTLALGGLARKKVS